MAREPNTTLSLSRKRVRRREYSWLLFWLRFHTILRQPFIYTANQSSELRAKRAKFSCLTLLLLYSDFRAYFSAASSTSGIGGGSEPSLSSSFFRRPLPCLDVNISLWCLLKMQRGCCCKLMVFLKKKWNFLPLFSRGEKCPSFPLFFWSSQVLNWRWHVRFHYPFISIGSKCEELSHFLHLKRCHFRWHPIVHFYINVIMQCWGTFLQRAKWDLRNCSSFRRI